MSENARLPLGRRPTFSALRKVYQPAKAAKELCDLCSEELASEHQHLLDPHSRQILCACDACALLFSSQEGTKFRRIPRRVLTLSNFQMTDAAWESLLIPVGMAFFFYNSQARKVAAYYPSPAGATESLLDLDTWDELAADNPVLKHMEPDVEALLVNRLKGEREYYLAPIDKCYELVGLIRLHWKGLSGGEQVWKQIDAFFTSLKAHAQVVPSPSLEPGASPAAGDGEHA